MKCPLCLCVFCGGKREPKTNGFAPTEAGFLVNGVRHYFCLIGNGGWGSTWVERV